MTAELGGGAGWTARLSGASHSSPWDTAATCTAFSTVATQQQRHWRRRHRSTRGERQQPETAGISARVRRSREPHRPNVAAVVAVAAVGGDSGRGRSTTENVILMTVRVGEQKIVLTF